jgi:16S rRNA (uracil1498-N3)-methyltransferase
MPRFFLDREGVQDGEVLLSGDAFRQITRVLRLRAGDAITLFDRGGFEYSGCIKKVNAKSLRVEVAGQYVPRRDPPMEIVLAQGLPKLAKMDLIVQKAVELGVDSVIPFASSRSHPPMDRERSQTRVARWRKIAFEAARQCGRTRIPEVAPLSDLGRVCTAFKGEFLKLILWEGKLASDLKSLLKGGGLPRRVLFLVGPEGGFSVDEVCVAQENGFVPVTLGRRILRTETASLALLAILQYEFGDLGSRS